MSEKARDLIRQAVEEYQSGDGASRLGSYRDVVTDLLHLAAADKELKDRPDDDKPNDLHGWLVENLQPSILGEAYDLFMEERENAELEKVNNIPLKELPLHIVRNKWEFDTSLIRIEERLKGKFPR